LLFIFAAGSSPIPTHFKTDMTMSVFYVFYEKNTLFLITKGEKKLLTSSLTHVAMFPLHIKKQFYTCKIKLVLIYSDAYLTDLNTEEMKRQNTSSLPS